MKNTKVLIKIVFSLVLISIILLKKVNFSEIVSALGSARPGWIVLAMMLHPLGLLISTCRWSILLRAQSVVVPIRTLFQSYLVCTFFNQFLPTSVGGDLMRAFDTRLLANSGVKSFAIVFIERVSGMSMLFLFALVLSSARLLQGVPEMTQPIYIAGMVIGLMGIIAVGGLSLKFPVILLVRVLEWIKLSSISRKVELFHETIRSYWQGQRRREFLMAFLLAFFLQMNVILYYYLLGVAFQLDRFFDFYEYLVIVPLVQVILLTPFFINGIGLREASWIGFFERFGVASATAFAFSVVDFCMYLVFGIIGGIIYAFRR